MCKNPRLDGHSELLRLLQLRFVVARSGIHDAELFDARELHRALDGRIRGRSARRIAARDDRDGLLPVEVSLRIGRPASVIERSETLEVALHDAVDAEEVDGGCMDEDVRSDDLRVERSHFVLSSAFATPELVASTAVAAGLYVLQVNQLNLGALLLAAFENGIQNLCSRAVGVGAGEDCEYFDHLFALIR